LVRLTLSLTRTARIAVTVAAIGAGLALYGKLQVVDWAAVAGTVLLFGGAIVYYVERLKMFRRRRDGDIAATAQSPAWSTPTATSTTSVASRA
jgi:hypothetical protein